MYFKVAPPFGPCGYRASGWGADPAARRCRLIDPERGSVNAGGIELTDALEAITGRRMAYVGQTSFIFAGTIASNLYYGLKHRPMIEKQYEGDTAAERARYVAEAERSGNAAYDLNADWIDYEAAGAEQASDLPTQALRVLTMVGLSDEIYQFGLRGTIDSDQQPELADLILNARTRLRERLRDPDIAPLVEIFDRGRYNANASVGENLLFGNPVGEAFDPEHLADNDYVGEVLERAELTDRFLQVGYQLAATMVELFADLPPEHELFQQFSFVSADDLPEVQALLQRADRGNLGGLVAADRSRLLSLPFMVVPARHRLGLIDEEFQTGILAAREIFANELPAALSGTVEFFDVDSYNRAANLLDNILFGKVAYGQARAQERVGELIGDVVAELGLRDTVAEVGLEFDVGIAGARLSGSQRQRLALARAILKRPDVLIMFEATASLDSISQARIMENVLAEFTGRSLIWGVHRPAMAEQFDQVLVMRQGRVVEHGAFAELNREGTFFHELMDAE